MPPVEIAPDNEAALPEEGASTALALTDVVGAALVDATAFNTKVAGLADEARKYHALTTGTVADPRTTAGMATLVTIRARFRDEFRIPMQEAQTDGSKVFGTLQRKYNEHARALIAEVAAMEKPWDEIITAENERKASIKAEKDRLESLRKQGHVEAIARISSLSGGAAGMDSAALRERITQVQGIIVDEGYEEFQGQAAQAKDEALRQLNGMLVAAQIDEEDRADMERTRQQQAAFKAQQDARERQLAAEREAFEAEKREHEAKRLKDIEDAAMREREQREAAEKLEEQRLQQERAIQERALAVSNRIHSLGHAGAAFSHMAPSESIAAEIERVRAIPITADLFDDRIGEAEKAKNVAIGNLRELHAGAVAREAEEAAQARADKIQELLDGIRKLGEHATMAVQDGSAELIGLRAGLVALTSIECAADVFGDRLDEAATLKLNAAVAINDAIDATIERDRARAEEGERIRLEVEEGRLARERQERMQSKAAEMFALLDEYIGGNIEEGVVAMEEWEARVWATVKFVENNNA